MNEIARAIDYDDDVTRLCERAQLTLLKCAGPPWSERIYLAGGLVPKYLITKLPELVRPHVGTMDIDLVVGVAVMDDGPEPYDTLVANMRKAGFDVFKNEDGTELSFRWWIAIDGHKVAIEFITEQGGEPGKIMRPRQGTGSKLGAFEARGAGLVALDFVEREIRGQLCDGSTSFGTLRVANLVPFITLKALAQHDRGVVKYKDAYDIVFTIGNWPGGPAGAGAAALTSPVIDHPHVREAFEKLHLHFASTEMDGPVQYSAFLFDPAVDDEEEAERLKLEAVATVRAFVETVV
ncbi:MAG: hypothetical protein ACYC77_09225 [Coriobacteriia bacterium]